MTSTHGPRGPISVLLYSGDRDVRAHVRGAIGESINGAAVQWHEVATSDALDELVKVQSFQLMVLDGEAHKVGGMGIARELKNSIFECPPILVLTGRSQDAWLASWSLADAAVPRPLDVFELQATAAKLVAGDLVAKGA